MHFGFPLGLESLQIEEKKEGSCASGLWRWGGRSQWSVYFGMLLVARRATYVVDGRFFGHFFWKVEGTVHTHVNSRVAHVWLPYTVINMSGEGGIANIGKLRKFKFL